MNPDDARADVVVDDAFDDDETSAPPQSQRPSEPPSRLLRLVRMMEVQSHQRHIEHLMLRSRRARGIFGGDPEGGSSAA
jgi:hypothetical protein